MTVPLAFHRYVMALEPIGSGSDTHPAWPPTPQLGSRISSSTGSSRRLGCMQNATPEFRKE
jgi:hypothetical protein